MPLLLQNWDKANIILFDICQYFPRASTESFEHINLDSCSELADYENYNSSVYKCENHLHRNVITSNIKGSKCA